MTDGNHNLHRDSWPFVQRWTTWDHVAWWIYTAILLGAGVLIGRYVQ